MSLHSLLSEMTNPPAAITHSLPNTIKKLMKKSKTKKDIDYLVTYFLGNLDGTPRHPDAPQPCKFFTDLYSVNGIELIMDVCKELKYMKSQKGDFIIKQDEDGYTYYIVLDGAVEVLINVEKPLKMNLSELFKFTVEQYDLIINDEKKQSILKELKRYFPKYISEALTPEGEKYEIRDLEQCKKYIEATKSFPEYTINLKNGGREVISKEFPIKFMNKVANLPSGVGFGELALLTNRPRRNASIRATSECHFAILHKKEFDNTLGKMKKKEIQKKIEFMNQFSFISSLSYDRKTKLASFMKKKTYTFGKSVYLEGDKDDNIYFIEEGDFEMTKDIYILQDSNKLGFRRMVIDMQRPYLDKLINFKNQIFVTTDENELSTLKSQYKGSVKNTTRMCLMSSCETFGLIELILNAPFRIFNIKCVSNTSTVYSMSKEEFFRRIPRNTDTLIENFTQKTEFSEYRIKNQAQVLDLEIDQGYYNSFDVIVNKSDCQSESSINTDLSMKSFLTNKSSKSLLPVNIDEDKSAQDKRKSSARSLKKGVSYADIRKAQMKDSFVESQRSSSDGPELQKRKSVQFTIDDIKNKRTSLERGKSIKYVEFELSSNDLQFLIQNYSSSKNRTQGINRKVRSVLKKRDSDSTSSKEVQLNSKFSQNNSPKKSKFKTRETIKRERQEGLKSEVSSFSSIAAESNIESKNSQGEVLLKTENSQEESKGITLRQDSIQGSANMIDPENFVINVLSSDHASPATAKQTEVEKRVLDDLSDSSESSKSSKDMILRPKTSLDLAKPYRFPRKNWDSEKNEHKRHSDKIPNLDIPLNFLKEDYFEEIERIPELTNEVAETRISDVDEYGDIFSPIRKTLIELPETEQDILKKNKAFISRIKADDPLRYQNILKYYSRPKMNNCPITNKIAGRCIRTQSMPYRKNCILSIPNKFKPKEIKKPQKLGKYFSVNKLANTCKSPIKSRNIPGFVKNSNFTHTLTMKKSSPDANKPFSIPNFSKIDTLNTNRESVFSPLMLNEYLQHDAKFSNSPRVMLKGTKSQDMKKKNLTNFQMIKEEQKNNFLAKLQANLETSPLNKFPNPKPLKNPVFTRLKKHISKKTKTTPSKQNPILTLQKFSKSPKTHSKIKNSPKTNSNPLLSPHRHIQIQTQRSILNEHFEKRAKMIKKVNLTNYTRECMIIKKPKRRNGRNQQNEEKVLSVQEILRTNICKR
ncbi:unnamed protein product [Moneuplotes crassus]|uniref:Cyclic nucleotide-binding domain-containing protein n=1 Tax=Euplotes crassus TaxID=5936 RepID=A0AAD1Y5X2_EUPCR|nr:unnamed protein product [Moneuplotes crassus]